MRHVLVIILFVLISLDVRADALIIHMGSHHSEEAGVELNEDCKPYNEFNPGLGYIYDAKPETGLRYEFGFFENSCRHTSFYVGFNLTITENDEWSVLAGVGNGWPEKEGAEDSFAQMIGQVRYTPRTQFTLDPVLGMGFDHNLDPLFTLSLERRW